LDESVPPIPDINTDINKEEEEEEAGWQEVVKCYQNNIRPICGEMERDELLSLYQDYGKEWVIASIHESVKNDVRKRSYMKAVLERWKVDGFGVDSRKKKDSQPSKKKASRPTQDEFDKARADLERRLQNAGDNENL
jgi:DNA replication protein DnaD